MLVSCLREGYLDCSVDSLCLAFLVGLSTVFTTFTLQYILVCSISVEDNEDPLAAEILAHRDFLKAVVSFWSWILAILYTVNPWFFLGITGNGR